MRRSLITLYYLAIPFAAAASGFWFQAGAWYESLQKPPGTPPNLAFPIVWNTLYLLMGIAAATIASSRAIELGLRNWALQLFHIQLLLNASWSVVFFGSHSMWLGLLNILALDLAVLITLRAFYQIRPLAGYLLVPYLAWILYATYLNAALAWLNR